MWFFSFMPISVSANAVAPRGFPAGGSDHRKIRQAPLSPGLV